MPLVLVLAGAACSSNYGLCWSLCLPAITFLNLSGNHPQTSCRKAECSRAKTWSYKRKISFLCCLTSMIGLLLVILLHTLPIPVSDFTVVLYFSWFMTSYHNPFWHCTVYCLLLQLVSKKWRLERHLRWRVFIRSYKGKEHVFCKICYVNFSVVHRGHTDVNHRQEAVECTDSLGGPKQLLKNSKYLT